MLQDRGPSLSSTHAQRTKKGFLATECSTGSFLSQLPPDIAKAVHGRLVSTATSARAPFSQIHSVAIAVRLTREAVVGAFNGGLCWRLPPSRPISVLFFFFFALASIPRRPLSLRSPSAKLSTPRRETGFSTWRLLPIPRDLQLSPVILTIFERVGAQGCIFSARWNPSQPRAGAPLTDNTRRVSWADFHRKAQSRRCARSLTSVVGLRQPTRAISAS